MRRLFFKEKQEIHLNERPCFRNLKSAIQLYISFVVQEELCIIEGWRIQTDGRDISLIEMVANMLYLQFISPI